jgi:hypothetical protein
MYWSILFYSMLGCVSMVIQDSSGTILVIAESRGKSHLAGMMDVTGDIAKFMMYAYSGSILMTHYGPVGWLGIIPILITAYITTSRTTSWAHKNIRNEVDEKQNDQIRELQEQIDDLDD